MDTRKQNERVRAAVKPMQRIPRLPCTIEERGNLVMSFCAAKAEHGLELMDGEGDAVAQYDSTLRSALLGNQYKFNWHCLPLLLSLILKGHRLKYSNVRDTKIIKTFVRGVNVSKRFRDKCITHYDIIDKLYTTWGVLGRVKNVFDGLGWIWESAYEVVTDQGIILNVFQDEPEFIYHMVRDRMRRIVVSQIPKTRLDTARIHTYGAGIDTVATLAILRAKKKEKRRYRAAKEASH